MTSELEFDDLKEFADFDAVLTQEQVFDSEKKDTFGPHRRSALMLLTMDSEKMKKQFRDDTDGEVMGDLLDMLQSYSTHLTALSEMSKSAEARVLAIASAICNE